MSLYKIPLAHSDIVNSIVVVKGTKSLLSRFFFKMIVIKSTQKTMQMVGLLFTSTESLPYIIYRWFSFAILSILFEPSVNYISVICYSHGNIVICEKYFKSTSLPNDYFCKKCVEENFFSGPWLD